MSKLEIIAWLLFASFGGDGGSRSDLSLFIMAGNVFGLGAVERQPVRWGNCAKPVL